MQDFSTSRSTARPCTTQTLQRWYAARDFCDEKPRFAATVALFAVTHLLAGSGYDPPVSDVNEAIKHLFVASRAIGAMGWARQELGRLADGPCNPGREIFQQTVKAALSRHDAS